MTVTPKELQGAIDTLSSKIDDRHDKIILKWDLIAKELSDTNINIGRFLEKFDHQVLANTRMSADIDSVRDDQIQLGKNQGKMSQDIVLLIANQANIKSNMEKYGPPMIWAAILGLSAINYFKG